MKGNNEMILNRATMVEALQLWAEKTFSPDSVPTITGVEEVSKNSSVIEFKVTMEEGRPDDDQT